MNNIRYWYGLRMCYLLSEGHIGHTEPTIAERWIWSYQYHNARIPYPDDSPIEEMGTWILFLEEELFGEGIPLPAV